jgi:hypothetical protein
MKCLPRCGSCVCLRCKLIGCFRCEDLDDGKFKCDKQQERNCKKEVAKNVENN